MGRQSKCPGCKALKSAHDFGRPGKDCTGPVRVQRDQLIAVSVPINFFQLDSPF